MIRLGHCILSRRDSDQHRWLAGHALSYGPRLTSLEDDQAIMANSSAPAVSSWWDSVDPMRDIAVTVNHQQPKIGTGLSLFRNDEGISAGVVLDETPASDLLLELGDQQPLGFSVGVAMQRWRDTGRRMNGLPLIEVEQAAIFEISVVPSPADDEAWVYRVGAERPDWLARSEAIERAATLQRMQHIR